MIVDSVLGLVGNTGVAALDAGGRPDLLVKLDGDNPSGSIFDRLLTSAVFVGVAVAVRQHDVLAAALALATGSLGLPLTLLTDSPASNSARMAAAFGAKIVPSTERELMCAGVALKPEKAPAALVEECVLVRGHDKYLQVVIPAGRPVRRRGSGAGRGRGARVGFGVGTDGALRSGGPATACATRPAGGRAERHLRRMGRRAGRPTARHHGGCGRGVRRRSGSAKRSRYCWTSRCTTAPRSACCATSIGPIRCRQP